MTTEKDKPAQIRSFHVGEQWDLTTEIFDELADGQWHPVSKMTQRVNRGSYNVKTFRPMLEQRLEELTDMGFIHRGDNNSYRFITEHLLDWRMISTNPKLEEKQYQPRWFGGVLEDDGWELAELKPCDLVHFRADGNPSRKQIHAKVGGHLKSIQIEDGLYRVLCQDGETTVALVKELKAEQPTYGVSGVRLERNLRRRDLEDLPSRFLDDLVQYYGQFAKVLIRQHMSSVLKHLPEPDDVQQQIYVWILDAIQRYDSNTSIPFAAYLAASLNNWVFNLNRRANGRSAADTELRHARASALFKAENGRDPSREELAAALGVDVTTAMREAQMISTVMNLRNIATINDEENEIQVHATSNVEGTVEDMTERTILSSAITTAAIQTRETGGGVEGLVAVYNLTWGGELPKKSKDWLATDNAQASANEVMQKTRTILERSK